MSKDATKNKDASNSKDAVNIKRTPGKARTKATVCIGIEAATWIPPIAAKTPALILV
jgi:hypothetical protein